MALVGYYLSDVKQRFFPPGWFYVVQGRKEWLLLGWGLLDASSENRVLESQICRTCQGAAGLLFTDVLLVSVVSMLGAMSCTNVCVPSFPISPGGHHKSQGTKFRSFFPKVPAAVEASGRGERPATYLWSWLLLDTVQQVQIQLALVARDLPKKKWRPLSRCEGQNSLAPVNCCGLMQSHILCSIFVPAGQQVDRWPCMCSRSFKGCFFPPLLKELLQHWELEVIVCMPTASFSGLLEL